MTRLLAMPCRWVISCTVCAMMLAGASARAAVPSEDGLLKIAADVQAGPIERTRAFADLRAVATERSIPALVAWLADPRWSFPARSVLEAVPAPAADRALLRALESAVPDALRVGLVNSLGNRRSAAAVPAIAKLLTSSAPALAEAAIRALGTMGTAPAADALIAFEAPAPFRVAWGDALLRLAEALQPADAAKAGSLRRLVVSKGEPAQAAAASIALAFSADQPVTAVIDALRSTERPTRLAALALIRSGKLGAELTESVGRAMPLLPLDAQVQVLSVLYDRGDRAAAPLARPALESGDADVRTAAARLLSVVGGPADAPALIRMMTGVEEPAPSGRWALARIPGQETTDRLLDAFRGGGERRAAALEVLVARGYRPLLAGLLAPALHHEEEYRPVAANAILALATGADLGRVLALHAALPADARGPLEGVMRRLAAKHSSRDEAAATIFAAAEELPPAEASPLFVIVAGVGGDAALASLSTVLTSPALERRQIALRALGNWRDISPATTLLAVAREDSDPTVRALAIKAATAVFARGALGENNAARPELVPAVVEGLRKTWALTERPEGKTAILAALRGLKDARAVALAEELERTLPREGQSESASRPPRN